MDDKLPIYSLFAAYREGAYDLSGLLTAVLELHPDMTVQYLAMLLDAYFEDGGE